MTLAPRKNASKPRGKPFGPGNPGKPKGARHRATIAAEVLLDGEAEALTRKAVELAKGGDLQALRICLERILPPRRDRPLQFDVGPISTPADALAAAGRALQALGDGELTPDDASAVVGVIDAYRRMLEATEIEARLSALEKEATK